MLRSRTTRRPPRPTGVWLGILAAATFGASTPVSKRLLDDARPQLLAGLLYLGAFVALAALRLILRDRKEAPLSWRDAPRMAGVVVVGGVLAPVAMLAGLERVSGASGSLLLNLEGPFTLLLATLLFREHLDARALLGAVAVFGGAALLTTTGGAEGSDSLAGVGLVASAGLLWALDNNLTQSLTERDPWAIVLVKTGVSAAINLVLAIAVGDASIASGGILVGALGLGAVSYGISVVLDAYALRELGAARESAIFATAPFIGLALSIPVLGHEPSVLEIAAAAAMAGGVFMLVRERHAHLHAHDLLVHEHRHSHDEHHQHTHDTIVDPSEPHSHPHRHEGLTHAHPHVSDAHHRHAHRSV